MIVLFNSTCVRVRVRVRVIKGYVFSKYDQLNTYIRFHIYKIKNILNGKWSRSFRYLMG
jgi:hypothetical protein